MRRFLKIAAVIALTAAMLCSGALAATYGAKVLMPSMSLYNSSKKVVGELDQGASIKVTAMSGDWARITYKGKTYYSKLKNIIFNTRVKAVSTKDTPIRFATKASYAKGTYYKATLAAGTVVYVKGFNGDQLLVSNDSGSALGYVKRSALRKN